MTIKSEKIKKNIVIVKDYPDFMKACDVREYRAGDDADLAAGRVTARELPLSGEWVAQPQYEWGDQRAVCFARWNKATGKIQIAKAHGSDEDLCLDKLGNLWELRWNSFSNRWDHQLVG